MKKPIECTYSQEELYKQGVDLVLNQKYKKASNHFFKMYTDQPASKFASNAMLLEAYSLYKNKDYLDAVHTLKDLETFHPKGCPLDYVYYLKMLCYEKQIQQVEGCSGVASTALKLGYVVASLFPDSPYAEKVVKFHVPFIQNYLIEKEMYIGRLHLEECNPVGAILSFQNVINVNHDCYFVPEALFRMIESYLMMGLQAEALECQKTLNDKFAGNFWTNAAISRIQNFGHKFKKNNIAKD
jgi:outer membrane protein assembly factor BamD